MSAHQRACLFRLFAAVGGASCMSRAEPHLDMAQSGASRSVSPESARIEWRLLDAR